MPVVRCILIHKIDYHSHYFFLEKETVPCSLLKDMLVIKNKINSNCAVQHGSLQQLHQIDNVSMVKRT